MILGNHVRCALFGFHSELASKWEIEFCVSACTKTCIQCTQCITHKERLRCENDIIMMIVWEIGFVLLCCCDWCMNRIDWMFSILLTALCTKMTFSTHEELRVLRQKHSISRSNIVKTIWIYMASSFHLCTLGMDNSIVYIRNKQNIDAIAFQFGAHYTHANVTILNGSGVRW